MMQKPEQMELYPPELGNAVSYIIYFAQTDGLVELVLYRQPLI